MSGSLQIASLIVLVLTTAACGAESAVVGGTCKSGYVEYAGTCVLAPSAAPPTFDGPQQTPFAPTGTSSSAVTPVPEAQLLKPVPSLVVPPIIDSPIQPPLDPPIQSPQGPPPAPPIEPPVLVCEPPLVACRGVCISVESDPQNCGACGRICPSNICAARECVGATPGDVVLIGHDMSSAQVGSAHAKVLTNAVSIPTTDPIRVLSYEAGSTPEHAGWVRSLLSVSIKGRQLQFTTASADALESSSLYSNYDVVLLHGASGDDPAGLGDRWSVSLQTFTQKGGVFVAIDGGESDVPALVKATGLLDISSHTPLAGTTRLVVAAANDVVGAQVLSPFAAFGTSVGFMGVPAPNADLTWVVRTDDDSSLPTVIHKIAR